ncbi:hypothetical protein TNCV_4626721 [Trichonephila clavipes]|nr:hypothetical protein TNCV_4626721 [Trichonephila clavipes]
MGKNTKINQEKSLSAVNEQQKPRSVMGMLSSQILSVENGIASATIQRQANDAITTEDKWEEKKDDRNVKISMNGTVRRKIQEGYKPERSPHQITFRANRRGENFILI